MRRDPPPIASNLPSERPLRTILHLMDLAYLDDEARLVLHDALIERYGETYLCFVRQAQRGFVGEKRTAYIVTSPKKIQEYESWRSKRHRYVHYIRGTGSSKAKGPIPFEIVDPTIQIIRRPSDVVITYIFEPHQPRRDRRRRW